MARNIHIKDRSYCMLCGVSGHQIPYFWRDGAPKKPTCKKCIAIDEAGHEEWAKDDWPHACRAGARGRGTDFLNLQTQGERPWKSS